MEFGFLIFTSLVISTMSAFSNDSSVMEGRIVKGYEAYIHQYSYAVFLHFDVTRPASCGGSLIMVQAVITAAHCVDEIRYKRGGIFAFFGSSVPIKSKVVRQVVNYEIHPQYNEYNGRNNIVITFLETPVPLRHEIKKIPLANEVPEIDTVVFSVGWGKQIPGKLPDYSDSRHIRATKQIIMSRDECSKYAGFRMSDTNLCSIPLAGHHYKDDAGNGLILKKPMVLLVGVLSFVTEDVSIYTNLIHHRSWISAACMSLYKKTCKPKKG